MRHTCLVLAVAVGASASSAKPAEVAKVRVYLDAGHGSANNDGNHGAYCQLERDHTLAVTTALTRELPTLGPFEVKASRAGSSQPPYAARLREAEAWKADVVISFHSDARGHAWPWTPVEGQPTVCYRNSLEPGFAVLWNDSGPAKLVAQRARVGREIIAAMQLEGFGPYDGRNYGTLYRPDVVQGGWVDIRPLGKDVFFLRGSKTVPTVIIETHHALDVDEVAEWGEEKTLTRFARALARALNATFTPPAKDAKP